MRSRLLSILITILATQASAGVIRYDWLADNPTTDWNTGSFEWQVSGWIDVDVPLQDGSQPFSTRVDREQIVGYEITITDGTETLVFENPNPFTEFGQLVNGVVMISQPDGKLIATDTELTLDGNNGIGSAYFQLVDGDYWDGADFASISKWNGVERAKGNQGPGTVRGELHMVVQGEEFLFATWEPFASAESNQVIAVRNPEPGSLTLLALGTLILLPLRRHGFNRLAA